MGLIRRLNPVCIITGGGKTAATINSRLISVEVVDAAGIKSDTCRIEIDAGGLKKWPVTGQNIGVEMGWADTGTRILGEFKLSGLSETAQPRVLTLSGTAAPFQAADQTEFKKRRSDTHADITVAQLVQLIAKRHGFTPRIHADLAGEVLQHWDQNNETDIRFLSRVAKSFDAVCKPVDKLLVFGRRGEFKSLSGVVLKPVVIRYPGAKVTGDVDFTNANISSGDKRKFSGVSAFYYDDASADATEIELGVKPRKRLRSKYRTQQEAQRAAKAELSRILREGDKVAFECPGEPLLAAEGIVEFHSFPNEKINAAWSCDRVVHSYQRSRGYTCSGQATAPGL